MQSSRRTFSDVLITKVLLKERGVKREYVCGMGAGLPRYVCRECGEVIVGCALTSLRHHELGLTSIRCLSHKAYIMLAKIKRRERKEE